MRSSRPILSSVRRRLYSVQAASKDEPTELPPKPPQISKLRNGAIVASIENYSPITRLGVVYSAGSRYEHGQRLGLTHCLRLLSSQSTEKCTSFGLTRTIQQMGGNLSCSTTRDHVMYNVECLRDNAETAAKYLALVCSAPCFKTWEVKNVQERMRFDLASLYHQPQVKLTELLHQAAYRNTLGNSLYAPDYRVGNISSEELVEFVRGHYTDENMAVVGLGIEHSDLVDCMNDMLKSSSATPPTKEPAKYHGGEIRRDTGQPFVHASIVTEGASIGSKDLLAASLLGYVMGTGPYVKYGSNVAASKVGQAAAKSTRLPFAVSSLNASYTDSGLFGFSMTVPESEANSVLKSVFSQYAAITKGAITDADVQRAKNQLKSTIFMSQEDSAGVLYDMAIQALETGKLTSPEDMAKSIDSVTTNDVVNVAKKIVNGKPTMAAIGGLSNTPYLDELM